MWSYSIKVYPAGPAAASRDAHRYWCEAGQTFGAFGNLETPRARWAWLRAVLHEIRCDASCRHERRALGGVWASAARATRASLLAASICTAGGCASSSSTAPKVIASACGVARAACAVVETTCGVADAVAPSTGGEGEP